ncbi:MAG: NAD(P)H-dependent oxidoreductase [Flavobacteriales bacterium]|nr:NAD(P)H-dependent oxidoreductase [Flavobacteriales bacterium]
MKNILAINGSASAESANLLLLETLKKVFSESFSISVVDGLWELPLYTPQREEAGIPDSVQKLRNRVAKADAVIISTPEYLHNIPAVLKNALEWMTHSGELADKPVLPITFTPHEPRGAYAMASLTESLKASKARVVAALPLYRTELPIENGEINLDEDIKQLISEALSLF